MDQVIGIVLVHLDLFQDHAFFAGDVFGLENGIEDKVAENIQGYGQMLVQDLDVEADGFLARKGVHVAANGVHLPGNISSGTALGALKYHVLNEMRDTVGFGNLIAGARLHPNADGDRANMVHLLAEYKQTIGKEFAMNITSLSETAVR